MSASIPDTQVTTHAALDADTATQDEGKVVQLPLDEAARRRQDVFRVNRDLRRQLALLSQHYAEDTVKMHEALQTATSEVQRATREVQHQRCHSANVEARLFSMHGDLQFVRERLSHERRRAARLAEIARLPWWAFARRRWSLASMVIDDAN
ncbi:MAG: hypothetical protein ACPGU1_05910 [Myxococcota bacterium]